MACAAAGERSRAAFGETWCDLEASPAAWGFWDARPWMQIARGIDHRAGQIGLSDHDWPHVETDTADADLAGLDWAEVNPIEVAWDLMVAFRARLVTVINASVVEDCKTWTWKDKVTIAAMLPTVQQLREDWQGVMVAFQEVVTALDEQISAAWVSGTIETSYGMVPADTVRIWGYNHAAAGTYCEIGWVGIEQPFSTEVHATRVGVVGFTDGGQGFPGIESGGHPCFEANFVDEGIDSAPPRYYSLADGDGPACHLGVWHTFQPNDDDGPGDSVGLVSGMFDVAEERSVHDHTPCGNEGRYMYADGVAYDPEHPEDVDIEDLPPLDFCSDAPIVAGTASESEGWCVLRQYQGAWRLVINKELAPGEEVAVSWEITEEVVSGTAGADLEWECDGTLSGTETFVGGGPMHIDVVRTFTLTEAHLDGGDSPFLDHPTVINRFKSVAMAAVQFVFEAEHVSIAGCGDACDLWHVDS